MSLAGRRLWPGVARDYGPAGRTRWPYAKVRFPQKDPENTKSAKLRIHRISFFANSLYFKNCGLTHMDLAEVIICFFRELLKICQYFWPAIFSPEDTISFSIKAPAMSEPFLPTLWATLLVESSNMCCKATYSTNLLSPNLLFSQFMVISLVH